jgi:hypothetical protein
MPNMTINEAAEHFGVSKEAIHNRVRRGSLVVSIVDGVKFVEVDSDVKTNPHAKLKTQTRTRNVVAGSDDRYYKLLEEQNATLQTKVEKLENETRGLRDQKEQMLIQERIKIEQIYKDKDEQLKNILNSISSQFMLNTPQKIQKEEHVEAEIEVEEIEEKAELISLKKYLKTQKFSDKKQEKIKNRFKKRAKKDERIISLGSKFYVDTLKYDYKDLLK